MRFKNVRNVGEGVEYDVELSTQEVDFLTTFAVERLLQEGIISLNGVEEDDDITLDGASTIQ